MGFRIGHRVFNGLVTAGQPYGILDAAMFCSQAEHRRLTDIGPQTGEWFLDFFIRVEHIGFRLHQLPR